MIFSLLQGYRCHFVGLSFRMKLCFNSKLITLLRMSSSPNSHHGDTNQQHQLSINFMNLNEPRNQEIRAIQSFHGFPSGYIVSPPLMARAVSLPQRRHQADSSEVEVVVERKQKRLIKNRESAARSRARKLAYTNELENKISRLEEEIKRLRQEKEELAEQFPPMQEPKIQFRRSNSAPL